MAKQKEFTTVRVDQDIYDDVVEIKQAEKPSPTITHLINTLLAEAIAARKKKGSQVVCGLVY